MTSYEQPDELLDRSSRAARRSELRTVVTELDQAITLERAQLRSLPGLPLPGTLGAVADRGLTPGSFDEAAESARRLRDLLTRRDTLAAEIRSAELRDRSAAECQQAAVDWINALANPQQLIDGTVPDPAILRPPFPPPPDGLRLAAAILRFRNRQPQRRIRRLVDLLAVTGVQTALMRHLLHTGCVLAERDTPPVTVGVLLPVRIETRFGPGRLRVRVVPDEPWFTRHDPQVSTGELGALERYLAALGSAADEASRSQAWREFVAHVGGARGVFLIRTFVVTDPAGQPVVRPVDSSEIRDEPAFPRIDGFPDQLRVWLARGGGPPAEVLSLPVNQTRLLADPPDPQVPGDRRWWEDWDEAVLAGLAGEITLDGNPDDIDALYVTGIGDGDPAKLFASHRDEGRLGVTAPGTPTNTVDGAPAAPLGQDPDTWWDVLQSPASDTDRLVSAALSGDPDLLGNLPGPAEPHSAWNTAMVAGLWPALWGFAGEDVWGIPEGTNAASIWARHALFPEGPFPTLRIGQQPYGLLPATALARWTAGPAEPPVETALISPLLELREAYRAAAEARGTVVGASSDRLIDLLGQVPTSPVFRHRRAWPLELWWLVVMLVGLGVPWVTLDAAWRARYATAGQFGLHPARRYGTVAAPRRLAIPLVLPPGLPAGTSIGEVIHHLVTLAFESPGVFASTNSLERQHFPFALDSLLLRLTIRSLQVAIGDVGRAMAGEIPPGPEPVARGGNTRGRVESWIARAEPEALLAGTAEAERFRAVTDGLEALGEIEAGRLERLLRATVDTAAFRIDPWLVGPPARRLQELLDRKAATMRLGVYGWVDQPRPGQPGPTTAGLIHTPSPGQALTATVLRDRAVNDPFPARWDLDLTSRTVRDADAVAEHVRAGAHLAEALGREVERIVAIDADITRLRNAFPVRTEHEGRRVCDGLKVLAAPPDDLGLDDARLTELQRLRAALDTYGDLLVAEAVHHVTEGRAEVAGAVMDAAAGLSRPPHLGLLRTPRDGRAVTTSVVVVLRHVAEPALPAADLERAEVSPASLADAATAAFVSQQVGGPAGWTFDVDAIDDSGNPAGNPVTVTLGDIGLLPADALALTGTDLARLALEAGAAVLALDISQVAVVGGHGLARYEAACRLVALIGRRPAGPDAVTAQADEVDDQEPVDADLVARYTLVRDTAGILAKLLNDQVTLTAPDGAIGTADPGTLARLVRAARSWGIAPDPPPATPTPADAAERRLVATASRAHELLTARLGAAPDTTPASPGEPSPAALLTRDDLVAALASLVSPTGQLAITARMPRSALPALELDTALNDDWLATVAAVRESLAPIDALHLAAGTVAATGSALAPWTNKKGDPWQQAAADSRRMVVAFSDPSFDVTAAPPTSLVGVAATDRFVEVIPAQAQTTGAAFGFDAPAARAPQAILLAVPPDTTAAMDDQTLVDVIAETRQLARARMARPADLDPDRSGLLPASLLPAAGATAVPLDPTGR